MTNLSTNTRRTGWARRVLPVAALAVLLLAGCGDDDESAVDTTAPTTTAVATTTAATSDADGCDGGDVAACAALSDAELQVLCDEGNTDACQEQLSRQDDGAIEPGLDEFIDLCRNGDASGCQQLSDATLQEICDEGQTAACQTYGARVGEGDPEGDGTDADAAGCRQGELESCVQLSDAALQEICDEGQTAACQVYLSRTGEG